MADRERGGDAETARASSIETAASGAERATVPSKQSAGAVGPVPGQTWARYVVQGALGAGGMGAVWTAHDPELDRNVALKVLHDDLLGRTGQERLRREARAMARVAHPNVVPVFDVGEHAGRIYYTMELVAGRSLKDWLDGGRAWREVAPIFVDAARGLAAIHAAGLVHRDVKPGNLLVGDDGRARIADLGIAMTAPETAETPTAVPVVATTTLRHAGTPAYMAPEQLRGAPGDAASDQFAFGLALWEALHGQPPFPGDTVAARLAAMAGPPAGARDVPRWLDAAARRAIALDPAARFPDVAALGRALDGPRGRRGPWIAGAIALAGAGAAAAVIATRTRTEAATPPAPPPTPTPIDACASAGAALDATWPSGAPARLAAALATTRGALDADPQVTAAELDRAIGAWRASARSACRRDAAAGWTPPQSARASRCLALRRVELGRAIAAHGAAALDHSLRRLVPPARCLDLTYLAAQPAPPAPASAARIDAAIDVDLAAADLAQVDQTAVSGAMLDSSRGLTSSDPLEHAARDTASALTARHRGDLPVAADDYEKVYYAGHAAGDDDDALGAATALIELEAGPLADAPAAARWIATARADAARPPGSEAGVRALIAAADAEGAHDTADAIADAQRGFDLERAVGGDDSPWRADAADALATALQAAGRHREAVPYFDQAFEQLDRRYGHTSPVLLGVLQGATIASNDIGEPMRAVKLARLAVQIVDGWPDAPAETAGNVELALGISLAIGPTPVDAEPPLARAVAAYDRAGDVRQGAYARSSLAQIHVRTSRDRAELDRAIVELADASAIADRALGPDDSERIQIALAYSDQLVNVGRCALALPRARRELAVLEHAAEIDSGPKLVMHVLEEIGACQVHDGHPRDAIATFERALAIPGDDPSHLVRADLHGFLVTAWLNAGERARAVDVERALREDLVLAGMPPARLAAIDAWIAAPDGPPPR